MGLGFGDKRREHNKKKVKEAREEYKEFKKNIEKKAFNYGKKNSLTKLKILRLKAINLGEKAGYGLGGQANRNGSAYVGNDEFEAVGEALCNMWTSFQQGLEQRTKQKQVCLPRNWYSMNKII